MYKRRILFFSSHASLNGSLTEIRLHYRHAIFVTHLLVIFVLSCNTAISQQEQFCNKNTWQKIVIIFILPISSIVITAPCQKNLSLELFLLFVRWFNSRLRCISLLFFECRSIYFFLLLLIWQKNKSNLLKKSHYILSFYTNIVWKGENMIQNELNLSLVIYLRSNDRED